MNEYIPQFDKYRESINEASEFSKQTFQYNGVPKYIEHADLWEKSIDIATKNGTQMASYGKVTGIYNNLDKNRIDQRKDWIEVKSPKYWRDVYNMSNGLSWSEKKHFDSIIKYAEQYGKVSQEQFKQLKRLESGDFFYHSKN